MHVDHGRGARGRRAARTTLLGMTMVLGLLLWARLRLVTDTPRSVYAVPESATQVLAEPSRAPVPEPPADPVGR